MYRGLRRRVAAPGGLGGQVHRNVASWPVRNADRWGGREVMAGAQKAWSLTGSARGPAGPFHAGRAGQGNNWACGNDVAACRACRLHNGEEPGPVRLMPQTTAILPGGIP